MTIAAVFCDIGGPIYDDENFVAAVLAALDGLRADAGAGPVDRVRFREIYDRSRAAQAGSLRSALAQEFGVDRSRLHERTREYWVHPAGTMYADVLPFLRSLGRRAIFGVLANQEAGVIRALERDGVAPYVDVWGISALVGLEKPTPEFFRWALEQAGVAADQAVHIGNRLDTDVRPAKDLGLRTVWVLRGEAPDDPTPEQLAEPDLAVSSLDGLSARLFGL